MPDHHKRRSSVAAVPAAATAARSDDGGGGSDSDADGKRHPKSSSFATSTKEETSTYLIGPRAHAEAAGSPAAAQALGVAPFDAAAARRALRAAIQERVVASSSASTYDPLVAAQMARRLAEDARQRLRALGYGRYKLVVQAVVGERAGQSVRCASRCLWGEGDGWASESYESDALYCVVQVHALYHE